MMGMTTKAPRWLSDPVEANTIDDVMQLIDEVSWHDSVVYSITCIRKESLDAVVIDARLLYDWDNNSLVPCVSPSAAACTSPWEWTGAWNACLTEK